MKQIVFISDFFLQEVRGGAEIYNDELSTSLSRDYNILLAKSQDINSEFVENNRHSFWIVSNFMLLQENIKKEIMDKEILYAILEHDHKYCRSNNPMAYENLVVPENEIINKQFFKQAVAVLAQSKLHKETILKNLFITNIINLECNLWSEETLSILRKNLNKEKTIKYAILSSKNKNKGMVQAIEFCRSKNIKYEIIEESDQRTFLENLAKVDTLVFFPQWMETYCRVAVEARILGCKMITNKTLGCASEEYFSKKGEELLNEISSRKEKVLSIFKDLIELKLSPCETSFFPKVSLITTFFKGERFIEGWLDSVAKQTYPNLEVVMVNANSPENEDKHILPFIEKYKYEIDIKYIKLEIQETPMKCFNLATKESTGEFISICLIDDRLDKEHTEILAKALYNNKDVDLVYGDCIQTTKENETMEKNSSRGKMYEHSRMQFTRENCIKSLMGPMPMYRKSMHEKIGGWDEEMKHAGDWKFMLEAVRTGSKLMKINKTVGLYYFNPNGLSTSSDSDKLIRRKKEERDVFYEYKDVFGERNFELYKEYFDMGVQQ